MTEAPVAMFLIPNLQRPAVRPADRSRLNPLESMIYLRSQNKAKSFTNIKHFAIYWAMKTVTYTKTAIKALRKIPVRDRDAIMDKIANYAKGGVEDVKALQGSDLFRLRHGDWRAIFDQNGTVLNVLNVAKRGEAYR
ncbi:MAG TPA: hypothetical protein VFI23_07945 [Rhizomicrobium sp.]|nr:hypothetical protein [Rhizomicrobium sp.]